MASSAQPEDQAEPDLSQAMDRLWLRFLPEIRERVAILEGAAAAVAARSLSRAGREAAQAAAHKLAGVLGTFSLARGTVLARELEVTFSGESSPGPGSGAHIATIAAELRAMIENRRSSPA